jgi:flagellar biosynthesis protein FlhF
LRQFIEAAHPHEVHLVLSATAGEKVLANEAEAFGKVGVDRLILTKIDEAASLGAVMNLLRLVGKPLSFITTGQEVPDHLEMAQPRRLAELMLGGAIHA